MDISVLNCLCLRESMEIRFSHRLLIRVKASRFIHVIPYMNIRVTENIILFCFFLLWNGIIECFYIFSSLRINKINPNRSPWPTPTYIWLVSLTITDIQFVLDNVFIDKILFIFFYMGIYYHN